MWTAFAGMKTSSPKTATWTTILSGLRSEGVVYEEELQEERIIIEKMIIKMNKLNLSKNPPQTFPI